MLMLALLILACKQKNEGTGTQAESDSIITNVTVDQASNLLAKDESIFVLDVRTVEEASEGKVEGAMVIDVKKDDFTQKVDLLKKETTYLVYCRSGNRSQKAVEIMKNLGFEHIYHMDGGYLAWSDKYGAKKDE